MKGTLFGVGVGPGDPELMTLKAVRMIRENEVIAVPGADVRETVAYKIAVQAVPELADKELLPIYMPMTHEFILRFPICSIVWKQTDIIQNLSAESLLFVQPQLA